MTLGFDIQFRANHRAAETVEKSMQLFSKHLRLTHQHSHHRNDRPKSHNPLPPIPQYRLPRRHNMQPLPPRANLHHTAPNPITHTLRTRPPHFPHPNRPQPLSTRRQNPQLALPLLPHLGPTTRPRRRTSAHKTLPTMVERQVSKRNIWRRREFPIRARWGSED